MAASHQLSHASGNSGPIPFDASIRLDVLLGALFADSTHVAQGTGLSVNDGDLAIFKDVIAPYSWKSADLVMLVESIERIKMLRPFEPFLHLHASVDARILRFLNLLDRAAGAFIKSQLHGLETRVTIVAAENFVKGQMVGECIADVIEITSSARASLKSEHLPAFYHTMLGHDYCITGGPLSLITHDCNPNCEIVIDTSGVASLRTLKEVKSAEILTAANAGVNLPCDCSSCLFSPSAPPTRSNSDASSFNTGLGIDLNNSYFGQNQPLDRPNVLNNWNAMGSALPPAPPSLINESSDSLHDPADMISDEVALNRSTSLSTPDSAMASPTRTAFGDMPSPFVSPSSSSGQLNKGSSPAKRPSITPLTQCHSARESFELLEKRRPHVRSSSSPYIFGDLKKEITPQSSPDIHSTGSSGTSGPSRNGPQRVHRRAQSGLLPPEGRKRKTILEPNTGIIIKERALFERLLTILRLSPEAPSALEHGQLVPEFRLLKDYLDKALTETIPKRVKVDSPSTSDQINILTQNELRFPAMNLNKRPDWLLVKGVALMDMAHAENRVLAGLSFFLDWQLALYHDKLSEHTSSIGSGTIPRLGKHDLHRKLIQDYEQVRIDHPELRLREVRGWDEMRRRLQVSRRMMRLTEVLGRALLISGLVSRRMLEQASEAEFGLLLRIVESHQDAYTWLVLESTKNHEDVISGLALLDKLFLVGMS